MRTALVCAVVIAALASVVAASEIHDAASGGDLEAVRSIVSADPGQATARDVRNDTPLHQAVDGGQIDVVRYLLDAGVPVDIGDNENTTPLSRAAITGNMEIAQLLIGRGADIRLADDGGATPLHWAVYNGRTELASTFLRGGADVGARKVNGATPLHGAAFDGHTDCVRLLLDHGADVNARTEGLYTPFLSAAGGQAGLDVVTMLLDAGSDRHGRNDHGENALMLATRGGNTDVVEYLLANGVSMFAKSDHSGHSAMHYAAMSGEIGILEFLVAHAGRVDEQSDGGWTPLSWAALRGHLDAVTYLLEQGADPDPSREDGVTPLMNATRQWQPEIVAALLEHGADANARDANTGRTVLHQMALAGLRDGVELALDNGADIDVEDNSGTTPIQYAARYGHRSAAELLKERGASTRGLEENYGSNAMLERDVRDGQSAMWYLGHCGWALKTDSHFLIFDYWNSGPDPENPCLANGHINPAEIEDEDVYVFVTHEHGDHFDPGILEWAKTLPNVTYVLGFRPELQPPYRQDGYEGPEYTFIEPREQISIGGMNVRTMAANDAGVGFLVDVDGLTLFHAGDHAGWAEGARDGYFSEIDYLAPFVDVLDMAFVNVTGCHAHDPEALKEGNLYTIGTFDPRLIIPTHAGGREFVYEEAAQTARELGIETPFCCPGNRGDAYFYSAGGLM